ncbi:hypothetical protein OUZ56_020379 [Daphnia magna]|uniref:Uncharacterized protein n=1 Tax=Daphnia magna TaxID=35525 RepID=A0ABQ9ZEB9_9CRUS|nr:hypothetical protein OUZ56_020379 [Daphnia magna]
MQHCLPSQRSGRQPFEYKSNRVFRVISMCDYPTYRIVSGYVVVLLARHIDISDEIRIGLFCGGGELAVTFPLRIDKVESNVALHEV